MRAELGLARLAQRIARAHQRDALAGLGRHDLRGRLRCHGPAADHQHRAGSLQPLRVLLFLAHSEEMPQLNGCSLKLVKDSGLISTVLVSSLWSIAHHQHQGGTCPGSTRITQPSQAARLHLMTAL